MTMDFPDLTTPAGVEEAIRRLITSLTQAQRELATVRDRAVGAELDWKAARRRARLSSHCPKVTRGGHTVADAEAWVDAQCEAQEREARIAEAARDAALDRLRVLRDDVSLLITLSASVRQAYEVAGRAA